MGLFILRHGLLAASLFAVAGCGTPLSGPGGGGFEPYHAGTTGFGQDDNSEVVVALPGGARALLVGSATRKLSLIEVVGAAVREVRSVTLFDADPTESEITHAAVEPEGRWAALSRTLVRRDQAGSITACEGELVFAAIADDETFGDPLGSVAVGPMPDAVALSPDGNTAVVANERDVFWGKCDGVANVPLGSLSVIDLRAGPGSAVERLRVITGDEDGDREPEAVAFGHDGDRVVVSLQDAHEVASFSLAAVLAQSPGGSGVPVVQSRVLTITALPEQPAGVDAWPDGVAAFTREGQSYFGVAGEANNGLYILDDRGAVVGSGFVTLADVDAGWPRDDWGQGPVFQPDSLVAFEHEGGSYLAMSLKSCGALALWDLVDPTRPRLAELVKVGEHESASATEASSVAPEGVAFVAVGGGAPVILTANEGESSVSVVALY